MKKRALLKKTTAYLLSVGVMQLSVAPSMAQETEDNIYVENTSMDITQDLEPKNRQSAEPVEESQVPIGEESSAVTSAEVLEILEDDADVSAEDLNASEADIPTETLSQETPSEDIFSSEEVSDVMQQETPECDTLASEMATSEQMTSIENMTLEGVISEEVTSPKETTVEELTETVTLEELTEEEPAAKETVSKDDIEEKEQTKDDQSEIFCSEVFYSQASIKNEAHIYSNCTQESQVIATLPSGYDVYITSVVLLGDEPVWARIIFDINDYSSEGYVLAESLEIGGESTIMPIDQTSDFPADYQQLLDKLHEAHPNWIFKPVYVGDTFSYAISQQMNTPARALVSMSYNECFRSLLDRDYNFRTNQWKQWEPNWTGASEETVRYYMDPRNFLNENDIFMFEALTYEAYQSEEVVEAALANSFMANTQVPGESYTYAWLFCWIGEKYNINPVALASRVRQEQGVGTSDLISGTYAGYENLYNYFNIQATGSTRDEIIKNGLNEAKTGSTFMMPDGVISIGEWNTPAKALIGGSLKFANQYILRNQNTLYSQKFDFDGQYNGKYWHQYMTNIMAPYSEGNQVRRSYSTSGQLKNNFVFMIPVYDERPAVSEKPKECKNRNSCINSLSVNDQEVITDFDKNQKDFYYYVGSNTVYANVRVKAAADTSVVTYANIESIEHKVEVCNIRVTAQDGTSSVYRLIITRGIEVEEGFFDDFDPDAYRRRYPKLEQEFGNDIDAYYEHYLLIGKAAGWDASADGSFGNSDKDNQDKNDSDKKDDDNLQEKYETIYDGVDYAAVFNVNYYLGKYPDLKNIFENDYKAALRHFVVHGIDEGRQASEDFNISIYKENYKDLQNAFKDNNRLYIEHYLEYGLKEGREAKKILSDNNVKNDETGNDENSSAVTRPEASAEEKAYASVYNYAYYKSQYADLRNAFGDDAKKYFEHFLQHGMAEGRQGSAEFNLKFYKSNYEDLKAVFKDNNVLYYKHYIEYGKAEGRTAKQNVENDAENQQPSLPIIYQGIDYSAVYDYSYYKKKYADLRTVFGDDPDKYLKHFVENGMAEGRQAKASFNLTAYKNRYADLRNAFGNNNKLYYMHYINNGKAEGRSASN